MRILLTSFFVLALALLTGCGHGQSGAPGDVPSNLHVAVPPHGGTPVALGDDYQMEWVLDAPDGKLQAFVIMDGERDGQVENSPPPVRITPPSFDLTIKLPDREVVLRLAAVANPATHGGDGGEHQPVRSAGGLVGWF